MGTACRSPVDIAWRAMEWGGILGIFMAIWHSRYWGVANYHVLAITSYSGVYGGAATG